jgi:fatty-acyl-CoA synthase
VKLIGPSFHCLGEGLDIGVRVREASSQLEQQPTLSPEAPMRSTMQDFPLTIGGIMKHGTTVQADSEVVTATPDGSRSMSYADLGRRTAQLANALRSLGIQGDQLVGTFQWNNAEHLQAYLAVPSMGAVLHTLNIRLFPEQLVYIANHAEDQVLIVDDSLVGLLAPHLPEMRTVHTVLVAGPEAATADLDSLRASGKDVLVYDDLLDEQSEDFDWPEVDERDAAAMCYTSGTTGNPKGVVYSHRSAWLHSLAVSTGNAGGISFHDRVLPIVPMFHANSWGLAYAAMMCGASLCMPDRWLQAEPLVRFIQESQPTLSGAVPTVWNDVLGYLDQHQDVSLDSLRLILCGGSAVPVALQKALQDRHGLLIRQAWGMTETSPVASAGLPPAGVTGEDVWTYRGSQGRVLCGVEGRIVADDGKEQPWDGRAVGELEVRGPWVTASYYNSDDPDVESKFREGWLRTGDVGSIDELGYIRLSDRAKDVIKSGGEWISSVDLENALMAHDDVVEAAVIGIPDEKWDERPLASVVVREGASVTPAQLRDFLAKDFAKWQLPDSWAFIEEVPRTSVGKFDKKVIRKWYAEEEITVEKAE